jgi:hypothetical protein
VRSVVSSLFCSSPRCLLAKKHTEKCILVNNQMDSHAQAIL